MIPTQSKFNTNNEKSYDELSDDSSQVSVCFSADELPHPSLDIVPPILDATPAEIVPAYNPITSQFSPTDT